MAPLFDLVDLDTFFTESSRWAREALKDFDFFLTTAPMDFGAKFPAHNLSTLADGTVVLELALAGYDEKSITLKAEAGKLIVKGPKQEDDATRKYFTNHRNIRASSFTVVYPVPSKYDISKTSAKMKNGILTISIPLLEEKKSEETLITINQE